MADFVRHEPCPRCNAHNNLARYSDGSATCFTLKDLPGACGYYEKGDGTISEIEETHETKDWTPVAGEYRPLGNRMIDKATCEFWGYQVGEYDGKTCHIASFRDGGKVIAQKLRLPGKKFKTLGEGKNLPFYGQWLWTRGKNLVITEGEIDALSMSKAFENKWPVVSLPNGVSSAPKVFARSFEWLSNFDRIVLMFDMDEPGQIAAAECAQLLPPGKAAIASLSEKDANEVLVKHGPGSLIRSFWDAPIWKPDGVVDGAEFTLEQLKSAAVKGYELPYPRLQEMVLGLRRGEITLLTAGSGIGKSTFAREVAYHLHQDHGCSIGNVFLEEPNVKTAQGYAAIHHSVPLGHLRYNTEMLSDEQWQDALKNVVQKRMWFYNHFGSLESKNLLSKLRYFATVCKVDFIILDHISIVTSGIESSSEGERKDIDILMTRLRSLAEETGVGIIAIVHLKRVTGKSFNEGAQVSLSDLRGSGSLEQLSDNVYALERDQQGDEATKMLLRVLKCRELGETGEADWLNYNRTTGRIEIAAASAFPDDLPT